MEIRDLFIDMEKLYHYTSFDSALKILGSRCLKYGRLNGMNDFYENDKEISARLSGCGNRYVLSLSGELQDKVHSELYKYRQISFTAEDKRNDKQGFDLHQMWGLYADAGNGVCLVFDKEKLLGLIENDVLHGRVRYVDSILPFYNLIVLCQDDVNDCIRKEYKKLFFQKRKEWEHEQEYRLMKRCGVDFRDEYFMFYESLKFIIVSSKLLYVDEVNFYKNIEEIKKMTSVPILLYGKSLLDYSLIPFDGGHVIWSTECKYGVNILGHNCELDIDALR